MPESSPAPLRLIFTTTSLHNVTIATASDEFYYEIVTNKWDPLRTKIRKLDPNTGKMAPIAEMKMERRRSAYTGVRFTNASDEEDVFQPLESFFQAGSNIDGSTGVYGRFTGSDGKNYQWQKVKGSIELFRTDEADAKSLARFHARHRHLGVLRMSRKPYIDIDSQLSETLDTIIVSFLVAERKRRGL